ncbi:MAG: hypothetical protein MZU95_09975 [Desulfomicrobium escambiense]|nr:hypothetical protein [Desulfomicrobium escambiense]
MREAAKREGIHEGAITFVDTADGEAVMEMRRAGGDDRSHHSEEGGEGLIRTVTENSRIPVLKHYKGVCHITVDREADLHHSGRDLLQCEGSPEACTCNAMETMLVDEAIMGFLPVMLRSSAPAWS